MQGDVHVNRNHKDRLFRFIFKDRSALLSLYNAVNDRDYTDPEALEIYTMDNFVYMGMKNDVSFLIDWTMNIFEHQSTFSPNMPIRGFMYMAAMFEKYIALNRLDIYGSKAIQIPIPQYYVFYNGTKQMEDEHILCLTDSMLSGEKKENACAEFRAHMININKGHNKKMMERCPLLGEYAAFIFDVRSYLEIGMNLKDAVGYAVDKCIENGEQLSNIMRGHKAEVTHMLLTEYDEAFHIASEKEISRNEGIELGRAEERERSDIFMLKLKGKGEEEIAESLNISLQKVKEVLSEIE